MSLITRCPACGTMFKVVPDQLRISEGWVRCGHCAEVFDASTHMQSDPPARVAQTPPPVVDTAPAPPEWFDEPAAPVPAFEPPQEPQGLVEPPRRAEPPPPQSVVPPALVREAPADDADMDLAGREEEHQEDDDLLASQPAPGDTAFDDVPFVRQARRKAFWRRPLVRVSLGLLSLLLLAALAVQVGVQERDRLAEANPALRPWLLALCEPLHCSVGPPRQIDAIVIDASSFSKLRGDAYRLNFTLRNQASTAIAMPSIELTLTDGQDQPVVRRVMAPAEMGATRGVIPASGDWQGSLAMSVAPAAGVGRIAGYRVLAFYP
ncbi:MAG: DUF3426 domain-containing protein [Ramlibacter sp.]|nr:DUF3426 domain-containing protein [Ramlibacter sp.]